MECRESRTAPTVREAPRSAAVFRNFLLGKSRPLTLRWITNQSIMKTFIILISTITLAGAQWPPPKAPSVAGADVYVEIPGAVLAPTKNSTYRAIFDATRPAGKPTELLPALNMAGSELNALATASVPLANAKFAVVFHGPAVDGILGRGPLQREVRDE